MTCRDLENWVWLFTVYRIGFFESLLLHPSLQMDLTVRHYSSIMQIPRKVKRTSRFVSEKHLALAHHPAKICCSDCESEMNGRMSNFRPVY